MCACINEYSKLIAEDSVKVCIAVAVLLQLINDYDKLGIQVLLAAPAQKFL